MKSRLGEINVMCTNLDRSLAFYRDVLEFEEVEREGAAVRLRMGDRDLLLLPFAKAPAPAGKYGSAATYSFDIVVSELPAKVRLMRSKEVVFEREWKEGNSSAIIRDPDGMVIEVIQG